MTTGTKTSGYSHRQRAPLCLPVYAIAIVFIAMGWLAENERPIRYLLQSIGVLMLVVAASFHHLSVTDQGEKLVVHFGPIPLFRKTVRYEDIATIELGRTLLLDGWGIHMSIRGGWVWNLWGRDCTVIRFKNGGTLRIGTDDSNCLTAFLRSRVE